MSIEHPSSGPDNESKLRGKLAPKSESNLRGDLLSKASEEVADESEDETKLRETLIRKEGSAVSPEGDIDKEMLLSGKFRHRDSGDLYVFIKFTENRYGEKIILRSPKGVTVTLNLQEFIEKLKTPGSPWSLG